MPVCVHPSIVYLNGQLSSVKCHPSLAGKTEKSRRHGMDDISDSYSPKLQIQPTILAPGHCICRQQSPGHQKTLS